MLDINDLLNYAVLFDPMSPTKESVVLGQSIRLIGSPEVCRLQAVKFMAELWCNSMQKDVLPMYMFSGKKATTDVIEDTFIEEIRSNLDESKSFNDFVFHDLPKVFPTHMEKLVDVFFTGRSAITNNVKPKVVFIDGNLHSNYPVTEYESIVRMYTASGALVIFTSEEDIGNYFKISFTFEEKK